MGPSHIINIKKEKRETDEETKQILRMLEKDDVGTRSLVDRCNRSSQTLALKS